MTSRDQKIRIWIVVIITAIVTAAFFSPPFQRAVNEKLSEVDAYLERARERRNR